MMITFKHDTIKKFEGDYRWLSNFWPCDVFGWPTVEHAYQASKTLDLGERQLIMQCQTPGQAKRLGGKVRLRDDWKNVKFQVMYGLIDMKFDPIVNPVLHTLLIDTGDAKIEEGNDWGDTIWGICNGIGNNHLGKIIMQIRQKHLDWIKVNT
jgi:ribA/ribD-fused uncharacterized protein